MGAPACVLAPTCPGRNAPGLQELLDAARKLLVSNHDQLHSLSARSGFQLPDDQSAYAEFGRLLTEHDVHLKAQQAGECAGGRWSTADGAAYSTAMQLAWCAQMAWCVGSRPAALGGRGAARCSAGPSKTHC